MRNVAVALVLLTGTALAAETYKVDPVHTHVGFKVKHLGTSWAHGRFNKVEGKVVLDEAKPEATSIELTIQADSVDTNDAGRDKHLRSPDFFNVKEFPTITFKSTKVTKQGEAWELEGDLTLHGVTRSIKAKFELTGKGKNMKGKELAGGEATFTIKRSDFDMKYLVGPLGDEVFVTVSIEGIKE